MTIPAQAVPAPSITNPPAGPSGTSTAAHVGAANTRAHVDVHHNAGCSPAMIRSATSAPTPGTIATTAAHVPATVMTPTTGATTRFAATPTTENRPLIMATNGAVTR